MKTILNGMLALLFLGLVWMLAPSANAEKFHTYIGTYTRNGSEGVYVSTLDTDAGTLSKPKLAVKSTSPCFLAIHPKKDLLYCVNSIPRFDGKPAGGVSAFAIDRKSGLLTELNQQSSIGTGPCHIVVDLSGKCALVANYGGGSVAALPIAADGKLKPASSFVQHEGSSVNPRRQKGPHAHSINVSIDNGFAVAADLGLDKVLVYRLDPTNGTLTPNDPAFAQVKPGAGPRHFVFHPGGKFGYVINEIFCTITGFRFDAENGTLTEIQTITTLPHERQPGYSTAEIRVHPSGKFLYGSNRGHNSLAAFKINQETGVLSPVGHTSTEGETPRNFNLDPTGQFLLAANQNSDNVVLFQIDQKTGKLNPTGQKIEVATPVCIRFVPVEK